MPVQNSKLVKICQYKIAIQSVRIFQVQTIQLVRILSIRIFQCTKHSVSRDISVSIFRRQ